MATKKPANDAFQFAQFDYSKLNETYRSIAEKAIAQGTEAYDSFKVAAEEATVSAQKSFEALRDGMSEISAKTMENTRANTDAGVAFFEKLTSAKTLAEALELQGEYFRSAFETIATQAREVQELSAKVGEKTVAPAKEAVEKASAPVKAAVEKAIVKAA
ncbi:MAG: TIGR01841 family phasin [Rhizobiaceae bacterium]